MDVTAVNGERMEFRAIVEPPEPMKGLEVPTGLVEDLGAGSRPRVIVTINSHTWHTRIAYLRGRHLIGVSHAHRAAAGVEIGDEVLVTVDLDLEPPTVTEPAELTAALDASPSVRQAFDRLTISQRRQHIRVLEQAKKPETRTRRIEKLISQLTG
ncbi:YdeI/OmpD-associated family protein [Gordonia sp. CPCC 205515]|uniref:YdeI/OmpD-associated family protein n=1 Tax=Gordonia sp. CPCC 205515 TaxID=3140791 RepID=UPI003AF3337C